MEINLIGGFYKSKTLPWSAQDVVNWVPVKSAAGGTRSPYKLRGLPGLSPLSISTPPPPVPPPWLLKIGTYNEFPALSNQIFRSPDGLDWSSTTPAGSGGALEYANPGYDGTILLTSGGQTERAYSGDDGVTISTLYTGGPPVGSPGGRSVLLNGKWFRAGVSQRIAVSLDNGVTFAEATTDNDSLLSDVEVTEGGRLVGVVEGTSTYVSDDEGVTWTAKPSLDSGSFPTGFISIVRVRKTGTLVASYIASLRGQISISENDGDSWTPTGYRFDADQNVGGEVIGLTEWGNGYIAAATQSGKIACSLDDGNTFFTSPFTFPTNVRSISGDNSKLIVCGDGGQLWYTTDCIEWQQITTAYGDADILWVTQVP